MPDLFFFRRGHGMFLTIRRPSINPLMHKVAKIVTQNSLMGFGAIGLLA